MAKTSITHELAEKYPEFAGRAGETIEASELQSVLRKHGDGKTVAETVAEKKGTPASATAPARKAAPRKRAPAKKK